MASLEGKEPGGCARSRVPEYDAAGREFLYELVNDLMHRQDPVLAGIRRVPVDHIPSEASPAGCAVGMSAAPAKIVATVCDRLETIVDMDLDGFASMVQDAAREALDSYMPQFFRQLGAICDAAGQSIDAGQKPFSVDLWLDLLEKVNINFTPGGEPAFPELVVHPKMAREVEAILGGPWTPAQLQRRDRILAQKRNEFDARRRVRVLD
jgi:hypothetical protein